MPGHEKGDRHERVAESLPCEMVLQIKGSRRSGSIGSTWGKERNLSGYHFWARGYCVSTVGLDEQTIRDYIRHQEEEEKRQEQLPLGGPEPPSSPKKER